MESHTLPPQTFTTQSIATGPSKSELLHEFQGKPVNTLRTPALFIDRCVFARNCAKMHDSVKHFGAKFRAHVKTHKTTEGTRMQLVSSSNNTSSVVVSTLVEAWEIVNSGLVKDGTVDDILYGLPVAPNKLGDLARMADIMLSMNKEARVRLMIDNIHQVEALKAFGGDHIWSAFVKVDHGGKRAGLPVSSDGLKLLVKAMINSPNVSIYGFYCHAGDSYASTTLEQASSFLTTEMQAVNTAAMMALSIIHDSTGETDAARHQSPFILSVGSTPTAHSTSFQGSPAEAIARELTGGKLEIHAGNYPVCDLQQLHTGLIEEQDVAHRVLATVISYYPGRGESGMDEAMCDAGGIAMSRDTGPSGGYGDIIPWKGKAAPWKLGRCSQEHGILVRRNRLENATINGPLEADGGPQLSPGEQVWIVGQHACLTLAAYPWYYVLDSSVEHGLDVVQDVWVPWKGW